MKKKHWIFSLISWFSLLVMAAIIIMLLHMLYVLDLSKQKPYQLSQTQKNADLYLISYVDGPEVFWMNRNILASSAINRGFDFILNYRREHIDKDYIAAHPILNEKSGAGYWVWKPYIILKTLKQVPEGAIVMYADSGLLIRQPLRDLLEQGLSVPGKDVLLFNYDPKISGLNGRTASGDTFVELKCHEDRCRNGIHAWAGILAVRNSPQSRAFIAEWLSHCEKPDLVKGQNLKTPNYSEFTQHQHDEAILSILGNREADKVNYIQMDKSFFKMIHMHRRKTNEKALIGYTSINFIHMERNLPNWWWVKKLQSFFM